jgi:ABC-type antimicrobial peptide transport system permease subunit
VWSVDRDVPVSGMTTFDALISQATAQRRFVLGLLSAFAAAALVLTMVGIYGLLSYHVAQHTQEIGVRVALGARRADVFRLVVGRGLFLAAIGVVAGLIGTITLTRFLSGMLFGVEPTDPLTLASVSTLVLTVSLIACGLPALRATRLDAAATLDPG